jgi:hypothetical protein
VTAYVTDMIAEAHPMKFSTRHALSDKDLVELAEQRGREVVRLQLMLAVVERERDEALKRARDLAHWCIHSQRGFSPATPCRPLDLGAFVNDANILASDGPGTVVHKLQAAIDRALAER